MKVKHGVSMITIVKPIPFVCILKCLLFFIMDN